jgi:hypothetical protein
LIILVLLFQFSSEPALKLPKMEEEEEQILSFQLHDVAVRKGAILKEGFFGISSFYVRYSTLHHLPPLRFHGVRGCWDRTQDCCDFGIDSQTLQPLG